jgi:hypothetical protein
MLKTFEAFGQAQMLRAEGSRQLSSALAASYRQIVKRLLRTAHAALRHVPEEHPYP